MGDAVWHKSILQSEALSQYILDTSVYPREHDQLKQLREATMAKFDESHFMMVPPEEGQLLSMLLKIMNPKKTLEVGVFTGYSLLTTALALSQDAKITAIDMDKEAFEFGMQFIRKAGVDHKIHFVESDGISALEEIVNQDERDFDFALVDADKTSYIKYHEYLMKLVKVGGIVAYDNTLWYGTVALEDDETPEDFKVDRKAIRELNASLASDPRIELSQVPIGDGLTLCRRIK